MKFAYIIEPPFNYGTLDDLQGCDVALARHVCTALDTPFAPVETAFADLLPGPSDGRWHMTTAMFRTSEREKMVHFSLPIWALMDGIMVPQGNPLGITGYASLANAGGRLAVLRDQVQHQTALDHEQRSEKISVFETNLDAVTALLDGDVDGYASVSRAHQGDLEQNPNWSLESVPVPAAEKAPAFGAFAFRDVALRAAVDGVLHAYLGSPAHRAMMTCYGFSDADVDLIVQN